MCVCGEGLRIEVLCYCAVDEKINCVLCGQPPSIPSNNMLLQVCFEDDITFLY